MQGIPQLVITDDPNILMEEIKERQRLRAHLEGDTTYISKVQEEIWLLSHMLWDLQADTHD